MSPMNTLLSVTRPPMRGVLTLNERSCDGSDAWCAIRSEALLRGWHRPYGARWLAVAPVGAAFGRERGHAFEGVVAGHEVVEGRARVVDGLDHVGDTAGFLHDPQRDAHRGGRALQDPGGQGAGAVERGPGRDDAVNQTVG